MSVRKAFGVLVTLQSAFLALLVLAGAAHVLSGLARLPQLIAAASLGLGLVAVYPLRLGAWGLAPLCGWLARTPLGRADSHRPFQFGAALLVLLVALAERLPRWLPGWVPRLVADFQNDWARHGAGRTLTVWTVLGILALGLFLLLLAFALLVLADALSVRAVRPSDASARSSLGVLWNVLAGAILVASELPDLFSGRASGPADWRWWLNLVFALAIARRVLVVSLLMANDRLGLGLEAALAARTLDARIATPYAAAGLGVACAAFLAAEPSLGVAGAASIVVLLSSPAAVLLEKLSGRSRAGRVAGA